MLGQGGGSWTTEGGVLGTTEGGEEYYFAYRHTRFALIKIITKAGVSNLLLENKNN